MKIQSKYNDYYDSVAYMYGGGDPKIYYERDKYKTNIVELPRHAPGNLNRNYSYSRNFVLRMLVVGQYMFRLYRPVESFEEFKIITDGKDILETVAAWNKRATEEFIATANFRETPEAVIKVAREVGNPVFVIRDIEYPKDCTRYIIEDSYTPLHLYGLQKIYAPDQIYQDISYFLSNIMHDSPDMQPAGKPPQTDKEKIVAHGMDLKQSFRHRK